jgi:hypothetical protein
MAVSYAIVELAAISEPRRVFAALYFSAPSPFEGMFWVSRNRFVGS